MKNERLSPAITCKNCGHQFSGNYCNQCGEKVFTDHDKSILHLAEENLHFLTHFEGKFFQTLKVIFTRPGQLSADYCNGIRKRYFKPVSFFLLLVILYLLFPFFQGLNMTLGSHLNATGYSKIAKQIALPKFNRYLGEHKDTTIAFQKMSDDFSKKSEKTSKVLLFLIIPLSALPLYLLYSRKRKYFFDHLVLATEINSFFLIFSFFILAGIAALVFPLLKSFLAENLQTGEHIIGFISYLFLFLFSYKALSRFYQIKTASSILATLILMGWHFISVFILYKFLLFVSVMALI